jgi:hypothetical protein
MRLTRWHAQSALSAKITCQLFRFIHKKTNTLMGLFDFFTGKPSQDKFARMVTEAMQQAGAQSELRYDREKFAITLKSADGNEYTANLHNLYIDYGNAKGAERETQIRKYANATVQAQIALPADYVAAKKHLMPLIRSALDDRAALQFAPPSAAGSGVIVAAKTLCADIEIQLGFDSEFSIKRISPQQLQDWGVTFEHALKDAIENLRECTTDKWQQIAPGAFAGAWQDHYDTSRVLLMDCLYRLPIAGHPVVLMPTRETILVTGANDANGQAAIVEWAAKSAEQHPRRVSMTMLRVEDERWQPHVPEGPAGVQLKQMQQESIAQDYEQQKAGLEELYQRTGEDVYVATFTRMQQKGSSEIFSYSTWTEGVDTLLPQSELVMLLKLGKDNDATGREMVAVRWEDAVKYAGHLMEATDHLPVRVRVRAFPDVIAFNALRERHAL